jgi:hypothetical protein
VESSCEFGIQPSDSINGWETVDCPKTVVPSRSAQLHRVSLVNAIGVAIISGRFGTRVYAYRIHFLDFAL